METISKMYLKNWLLEKNGTEAGELPELVIIKDQTEKALLIESPIYTFNGEHKHISFWYPKSQLLSEEEVKELEEAREASRTQTEKIVTNGLEYYEELVSWAKEQGIKGVRKRMKSAKLYDLIEESGLEAPKSFTIKL